MERQDHTGQRPRNGIVDLRRPPSEEEQDLILVEIEREQVLAPQAHAQPPCASGLVRETCPHCEGQHLTLVLRQEHVRLAHLFCARCQTCFDAHYPNGRCALTI